MFIKKISLRNICSIGELDININPSADEGNWLLLLGDNGAGKTSALRSIAIGLCPVSGASALLSELYGEFVRYQAEDETAKITIEFDREIDSIPLSITTTIQNTSSDDYGVSQITYPESEFPWNDIFVCGYGARRGGYEAKPFSVYDSVDATYTLFNYDAPLQNAELALRRIGEEQQSSVMSILNNVLMKPQGTVSLAKTGFTAKDIDAYIMAGGWADGHRVTLNWLMDLIGWANMHDENAIINGISGIVIIDEIEQHLHPLWQRRIIKLLKESFPKVQFIASTHSSLCVIGATDLLDEECDLMVLYESDDGTKGKASKAIRGRRADQVLTSYLFGLDSIRSDDVSTSINRYASLKGKRDLNEDDMKELDALRVKINDDLGGGETELQTMIKNFISEALPEIAKKYMEMNSVELDAEIFDLEVTRQINNLYSSE